MDKPCCKHWNWKENLEKETTLYWHLSWKPLEYVNPLGRPNWNQVSPGGMGESSFARWNECWSHAMNLAAVRWPWDFSGMTTPIPSMAGHEMQNLVVSAISEIWVKVNLRWYSDWVGNTDIRLNPEKLWYLGCFVRNWIAIKIDCFWYVGWKGARDWRVCL